VHGAHRRGRRPRARCGRAQLKTAVVTGAASGIGAAVAARLRSDGYDVREIDREQCDVTAPDATRTAFAGLDGLDLLVPAAGIVERHTAEETDDAEWERVLAVNLTHVFRFCRDALPLLRVRKGSIVTIGSGWGMVAGPRAVSYAASKAAVVNLTRALAIDHGPEGIRVNCVCPGDTDTPMLRREAEQLGEPFDTAGSRPLRRIGRPAEVAAAVAWLASDEASNVTGATLVVDGGALAGTA
jgi:NAD(P)-dependent dehydrogenase (short-subunit alcohol dehydrogenase family)